MTSEPALTGNEGRPLRPEHEQIKALFNAVCDLQGATAQRAALQTQGVPGPMLAQVMNLLGHADTATRFSNPVAQAALRWLGSELKAGDKLGAWTLQEALGQGGMGRVFLAARSDGHYEQTAAIKLLLGWSSPEALARLTAERQILAGLHHPHIARLLDGGTTPGAQPYLVMEYVDGVAIDTYCSNHGLGLTGRLALFQMVCDAVAYAHRHLVTHCDIKPSNVLVTAEGQAMLLDFGIARLHSDIQGGEGAAAQAMTPGFASPEQQAGQAPGLTSDIFSLGRLLQHLLLPLASTHRRGDELAAVVARATEAAPAQRYDSVGALQRDLLRLLAHQPLAALPHPATYVLRKALRRRWPWALAGSAALAFSAAFTLSLAQERDRARAAEQQAHASAERATALARQASLSEDQARLAQGRSLASAAQAQAAEAEALGDKNRALLARQEALRQRDRAQAAEGQAEQSRDLALQEGRRAKMEAQTTRETSRYLMALFTGADPKLMGMPEAPKSLLLDAGRQRLIQAMNEDQATRARLQMVLGDVYERIKRPADAIAAFAEAADLFALPQVNIPLAEADALRRLALAHNNSGQVELGEAPARRALALRQRHDPKNLADIADAENRLGIVLINLRRYDEAQALLEHALKLRQQDKGADDPNTSSTLHNLARLSRSRGDLLGAEAQLRLALASKRRALPPLDERVLVSLEAYSLVLSGLQRHSEAETTARDAVAGWVQAFGAENGNVGIARQTLGRVLREAGQAEAALRELQQALRLEMPAGREPTVRAAQMLMDKALVLEGAGQLAAAEHDWRSALVWLQTAAGTPALTLATAQQGLAHCLWLAGRNADARAALAPALATRLARLPAHNDERLASHLLDAELALLENDSARAAGLIDEITARMPALFPALHFELLALRGHAAQRAGRTEQAAHSLLAAWQGQLAWRGFFHNCLLPLGLDLWEAERKSGQTRTAAALLPQLLAAAKLQSPDSAFRQRLQLQNSAPPPAQAQAPQPPT